MASSHMHGIAIELPDAWYDESAYRFAIPPPPQGSPFRSNLTVAKYSTRPDMRVEEIFAGRSGSQPQQAGLGRGHGLGWSNPTQEKLGGGVGRLGGRPAAWQDVRIAVPDLDLPLFQRSIGVLPEQGLLVVFVITTADSDLDALSRLIGFASS